MGVRQVRYRDLRDSEEEVAPHELQVDQMRVEIELAGPEYRQLLELLAPYSEAGRLEPASSLPGRSRRNPAGKLEGRGAEQLREL